MTEVAPTAVGTEKFGISFMPSANETKTNDTQFVVSVVQFGETQKQRKGQNSCFVRGRLSCQGKAFLSKTGFLFSGFLKAVPASPLVTPALSCGARRPGDPHPRELRRGDGHLEHAVRHLPGANRGHVRGELASSPTTLMHPHASSLCILIHNAHASYALFLMHFLHPMYYYAIRCLLTAVPLPFAVFSLPFR